MDQIERMHAQRGDVVGATGQAAKAAVELAHSRLCEQRVWVLNEKRILERAALDHTHALFTSVPRDPTALEAWVAAVESALR